MVPLRSPLFTAGSRYNGCSSFTHKNNYVHEVIWHDQERAFKEQKWI